MDSSELYNDYTDEDEDEKELEEANQLVQEKARELVESIEGMGPVEKAFLNTQTDDGYYVIEVRKTL